MCASSAGVRSYSSRNTENGLRIWIAFIHRAGLDRLAGSNVMDVIPTARRYLTSRIQKPLLGILKPITKVTSELNPEASPMRWRPGVNPKRLLPALQEYLRPRRCTGPAQQMARHIASHLKSTAFGLRLLPYGDDETEDVDSKSVASMEASRSLRSDDLDDMSLNFDSDPEHPERSEEPLNDVDWDEVTQRYDSIHAGP